MMAVVIEHEYAVGFPFDLEAALDSRHIPQTRLNIRPGQFQFLGNSQHRQRIQNVMAAWNADFDLSEGFSLIERPVARG